MNELSLFTGAGGGVLATRHLLGFKTIGYVENEEYAQKVIAQRIRDGHLDRAPIFRDIRTFNHKWAFEFTGMVDLITGGFPCQDISCAGSGAGLAGERSSLWFDMAATIRIIRPRYVFVENSDKLPIRGLNKVTAEIAAMGHSCQWGIISAADVGAPHLRKRCWIVTDADGRVCFRGANFPRGQAEK